MEDVCKGMVKCPLNEENMLNKIISLYILFTFFSATGAIVHADAPSAPDDKSSSVTAAPAGQGNVLDIKKLIENSRESIKVVNARIKEEAVLKRNQLREEEARQDYQKGMDLTREGKFEEARDFFKKAIRVTQNSEMAGYIKENQVRVKKQQEVEAAYNDAVNLYKQKQFRPAKDAFAHLDQAAPDYQATRSYLKIVDQDIAAADAQAAQERAAELQRQQAQLQKQQEEAAAARAREKQREIELAKLRERERQATLDQQARDIAALAERSAQLFHQISDVADDTSTAQTKVKMAQVDDILKGLKVSKERLLREKEEEKKKQQQEAFKVEQERRAAQTEKMYQNGISYLNAHEYAKSKINFLELEDGAPNYKDTRHYLSRIQQELEKANLIAITKHELQEAQRLKQLQEKQSIEELRRIQQEQEKQEIVDQQQQASLKQLAQKASDINDEIIDLSKQQAYEEMKAKFTELEDTVSALTKLKVEMAKAKGDKEREQQLAEEAKARRDEAIKSQAMAEKQIQENFKERSLNQFRPVEPTPPSYINHFKSREVIQEQEALFSEGVNRYEQKKYTQAKLLFGELAAEHDPRAEVWLKKVDHAITHELLRSQEGEEKERTAFLADQLKAQHELVVIQGRERQRQKKLTEELEHQKSLYEDDHLMQLRKEETIKSQERERQRQEERRFKLEKENEKQQEEFRFHKVDTTAKPPEIKPQVVAPAPPVAVPAAVSHPAAPSIPTPGFFQRIFGAEEPAARADRLAREEKRKEERQKEKARQQELRAEKAKEQAERSAREQKRREEILHEQEQQREERGKQEAIIREETKRKEDLENQERQHQAQLDSQREAVRKQLEDGVEIMYQDALSLFNQGHFTAAADRFKDVQDILPGYKRSAQYMDEARQKSLFTSPQASNIPQVPASTANVTAVPVDAGASPTVSRQDSISKALDLFDPNAK